SYMKGRIGQRAYYDRLRPALDEAFALWASLTGRAYLPVRQHRCNGADETLVSMGTIDDTTEAVVDVLRRDGRPVGSAAVTTFRPFPADDLRRILRKARKGGVVVGTCDTAAADNPLTRETKAALYAAAAEGAMVPRVLSVSAGLGSRDVGAGAVATLFHRAAIP